MAITQAFALHGTHYDIPRREAAQRGGLSQVRSVSAHGEHQYFFGQGRELPKYID
jgi:hypothetical protein